MKEEVQSPKIKESIDAYTKLIRRAKKNIKILVGDLNPNIFESESILVELENALWRDVNVEIIFTKDAKNPKEAEERIRKENIGILSLKQTFRDLFKIYWKPQYEKEHFGVSDSKRLVVEEKHKPFEDHGARFSHSKKVPLMAQLFAQKLKEAVEIKFDTPFDRFIGGGPKLRKPIKIGKILEELGRGHIPD